MITNEWGIPTQEIINGQWVNRDPSIVETETNTLALQILRQARNDLIKATDFALLPDAPSSIASKIEEIKAYRQALRDLPANTSDPKNVIWPVSPLA
jgi:hypothetical protein